MQVGLIGLGRMGSGMARRWQATGYQVVAFNRTASVTQSLADEGIVTPTESTEELVSKLSGPRIMYVMITAGQATEDMLLGAGGLIEILQPGDIIVDAGNSRFTDTIRRAQVLATKGINLVDQGTSGGVLGASSGYCVMMGGNQQSVAQVEPLAKAMAMEDGYIHAGPVGAGHYVKMIHNGIEYGMMQAMAEGFNLIQQSPFDINLNQLAKTWQHGSILESLLLEVLQVQLAEHPQLDHVPVEVSDNGEGQWTIEEAMRQAIPLPVITAALFARYTSRHQDQFANRVLQAMRLGFGGHQK